jgi:hypothetical protein
MAHMQNAYDNYDWDIAQYCLEQCADAVTKISSYATREVQPSPEPLPVASMSVSGDMPTVGTSAFVEQPFALSDFFDPSAFDLSLEALWDTPTGISIPNNQSYW